MKKRGEQSSTGLITAGQHHWPAVIVFAVAFLIYSGTLFNNYNLDDEFVTNNNALTSQGLSAIPQIFISPYYKDAMGYSYGYRPLTTASFALEHQFFGDSAAVSHFFNALLYALLCLVLYRTLLMAFMQGKPALALASALLFALHPIHTEVVSSIKNRDEILALLFGLLAVGSTYRFSVASRWKFLLLSLLFFVLALLSKFSVITLCLLLPLQLIFFSKVRYKIVLLWAGLLFVPVVVSGTTTNISAILLYLGAQVMVITLFYAYVRQTHVKEHIVKCLTLAKGGWLYIKKARSQAQSFVGSSWLKAKTYLQAKIPVFKMPKYRPYFKIPSIALSKKTKQGIAVVVYFALTAASFFLATGGHFTMGLAFLFAAIVFYGLFRSFNFSLTLIPVFLLLAFHLFFYYPSDNRLLYVLYMLAATGIMFSNKNLRIAWFLLTLSMCAAVAIIFSIYDFVFMLPFFYWAFKKPGSKLILFITTLFVVVTAGDVITTPVYMKNYGLYIELAGVLSVVAMVVLTNKKSLAHSSTAVLLFFSVFASSLHLYHTGYIIPHIAAPNIDKITTRINETKNKATTKLHDATDKSQTRLNNFKIELNQKLIDKTAEFKTAAGNVKNIPQTLNNTINGALSVPVKVALPFEIERPYDFVEAPVTGVDKINIRLGTALVVIIKYLKLLVLPYPQAFYYGYSEIEPTPFLQFLPILSLLIHALIFVLTIIFIKKANSAAFALFAYLVTIGAVSTFMFSIPGMMGDRYLLLPSISFCVLLAVILFRIFKVDERDAVSFFKHSPAAFKFSLILLVAAYSSATFARTLNWKDDISLMRRDILYVNQSAQAHNMLAMHLMKAYDKETDPALKASLINEALLHFNKALQIYPAFYNAAYYSAKAYEQKGLNDSAINLYKKMLTIDTTFSDVQLSLGNLLQTKGDYNEALPYFEFLINDKPAEYIGYDKLSYTYFLLKEYSKSINVNKQAAKNIKGLADPYLNIGRTYMAMGVSDSAVLYIKQALALDSNNRFAAQLLKEAGGN